MDYKKFQKLSMRTMPFDGENFNFVEFHNILSNYALGALGEWHEFQNELNKVNPKETPSMKLVNKIDAELGDVSHYLFGLLTIVEEEFDVCNLEEIDSPEQIEQDLSNIAEIVKKHTFHGHELDKEKFIKSIYRVISYIDTIFKYNIENILEKNIEKLKLRYPGKFNTTDSIKRVDAK